jgi:hypothetical protein
MTAEFSSGKDRTKLSLEAKSKEFFVGTPVYHSGIPDMHTIHNSMISVS